MIMPDFVVRFLYAMRLGGRKAPALQENSIAKKPKKKSSAKTEQSLVEFFMDREPSGTDSTLGEIKDAAGQFICYTCEDEYRKEKVMHETRIPAGRYEIKLRDEGGMTQRYADKFPEMHKGMLWLQDVENFEWIYIHIGNTDDHSSGCILVGTTKRPDMKNGGGSVAGSVNAYRRIYPMMAEPLSKGDKVFLTITDGEERK